MVTYMNDPFLVSLTAVTAHRDWPAQPELVRTRVAALMSDATGAHDRANGVRDLLRGHPAFAELWQACAEHVLDLDERAQWPGGSRSGPPLQRWRCTKPACGHWEYGDAYGPYISDTCPRHHRPLKPG